MSVEVILSSKRIELDQHSQAVLNLKATFTTVAPTISAIYKVRANSKSTIEVRPSFGVLRGSNEDDAIASLNIKYSGSLDDIHKVKIQVSWVWGQVPEKTIHYSEFSQLYNNFKERLGKERSHMIDFTSQQLSHESIELHQGHSSGNQSQEELMRSEHKEKSEEVPVEKEVVPVNKSEKDGRVSFKMLLLGVAIAFVLGLLIGFKIEPLIRSTTIQEQTLQANYEEVLEVPADSETKPSVSNDQANFPEGEGFQPKDAQTVIIVEPYPEIQPEDL